MLNKSQKRTGNELETNWKRTGNELETKSQRSKSKAVFIWALTVEHGKRRLVTSSR